MRDPTTKPDVEAAIEEARGYLGSIRPRSGYVERKSETNFRNLVEVFTALLDQPAVIDCLGGKGDAKLAESISTALYGSPQPLPLTGRSYGRAVGGVLIKRLRACRPRPVKPSEYTKHRDEWIAMTVTAVCDNFGLAPTRGSAARANGGKPSGCSVVTEALHQLKVVIDERAVEAIWNKSLEARIRRPK
jgi:hypothetical protein